MLTKVENIRANFIDLIRHAYVIMSNCLNCRELLSPTSYIHIQHSWFTNLIFTEKLYPLVGTGTFVSVSLGASTDTISSVSTTTAVRSFKLEASKNTVHKKELMNVKFCIIIINLSFTKNHGVEIHLHKFV